jgi:hypothetical protein
MDSFGQGGPLAQHAVELGSMRNGMAPHRSGSSSTDRPDIARTQFYFVDACRSTPPDKLSFESLSATPVFDGGPTDMLDDRSAPVFYAAVPQGLAQAVPGGQTLFSIALLRCLAGEAAEAPDDLAEDRRGVDWHISTFSLMKGLQQRMEEVRLEHGGHQLSIADGFSADRVLCYLPEPPEVPIRIVVEPTEAIGATQVLLRRAADTGPGERLGGPPETHPYTRRLRAGYYEFAAVVRPPSPLFRDHPRVSFLVEPLRPRVWKARMADAG